ncbi:MAG: glycosyltransferase family 39 protein [Alistipes sp.]|nr:glycosyltransferase family 39 protein [Candidatus Minthomonas equi]
MRYSVRNLSSNGLLAVLFLGWWILKLVQAGFTGLADDEAYYWLFARSLDWGYFDHPPVTALLTAMGDFVGGALGIRLFFTVLQPLALYLFWTLIRPENPTRRDAVLFFLICFSLPVAQLYGFIATPDAPLMFSVVVFLWAYRRICTAETPLNVCLLGMAMALMAYSKYHGALVLVFTVLSNPKLLKRPAFYLSGVITVILFLPHLVWQYQNDWVSFRYHLVGRNGFFEWNNLTDFIMNLLLIFNPFFVWFYIRGWGKGEYAFRPLQRALCFNVIGFILFFSFSSLRGYVQPQWVLPITYGLIMTVFGYARINGKAYRFVYRSALALSVLMIPVRYVAIFNPFGIKFEIFDNEKSYSQIAECADGRPVLFASSYATASKYLYYTGNSVYSQPNVNYRTSQWQFYDFDRDMTGQEVLVEIPDEYIDASTPFITLENGKSFHYGLVSDFHPVREVTMSFSGTVPEAVNPGDVISGNLLVRNPYPYDITIGADSLKLEMLWGRNKEQFSEYDVYPGIAVIPSRDSISLPLSFTVPERLQVKPRYGNPDGNLTYRVGFALRYGPLSAWIQSEEWKVTLCH